MSSSIPLNKHCESFCELLRCWNRFEMWNEITSIGLSLTILFPCEIVCPCTFPDSLLMDSDRHTKWTEVMVTKTECTVDWHYKCITRWKISFDIF